MKNNVIQPNIGIRKTPQAKRGSRKERWWERQTSKNTFQANNTPALFASGFGDYIPLGHALRIRLSRWGPSISGARRGQRSHRTGEEQKGLSCHSTTSIKALGVSLMACQVMGHRQPSI